MMGRVLAVAVLGLIGLLVVLRSALDAPASPRDSAPSSNGPSAAQPATPSTPGPAAPTSPSQTVTSIPIPRRPAPSGAPGTPSLGAGPTAPAAPVEPPPKSEIHKSMSDQVRETEPLIIECVEKAQKSGAKLTDGLAAFTFVLARKGDKVVVESVATEYTGIGDAGATECMQEVGRRIAVASLPVGVDAMTGYRQIEITNGELTGNRLSMFSQLRPPLPPQ